MIIELCDLLVESVGGSFEIHVERAYNPVIELSKSGKTTIFVVPKEIERKLVARGMNEFSVSVDLVLIAKLQSGTNEEIDPYMATMEQLANHCDGLNLEVRSGAKCTSVSNTPIYVEKWINSNRQFTSRLEITFTIHEKRHA